MKKQSIFIAALFFIFWFVWLAIPVPSLATQPYEDDFEAVPQGSGQCGPTSFYMIFNHFNDHQLFGEDDCSSEVDLREHLDRVTPDSELSQYINGGVITGTSWTQMCDAAENLRDYSDCNLYYDMVELNDDVTEYNDPEAEQERRDRLDYIKVGRRRHFQLRVNRFVL